MLSAEPVCSCAICFVHRAHETAGAARTRSSLRPLFLGGQGFRKTSGGLRRENANAYFEVIARSEATKQSILSLRGGMDCFASLAMTEGRPHCLLSSEAF